MKPKIICTVTNDLSYDQRMIRICSSLANNGYAVLLVGRQKPTSKPLRQQPFEQKRLRCFFHKGKLFYLEYNLRLFFFLVWNAFEVVCAVDLDTILPALYVSRIKGKKIVYDAHEYFTEVPEVVERPRVKQIWEWVAHHTIPNIKHSYTVCQSLQQLFKEKYNTAFDVIRNVPFQKKQPEQPIAWQSPYILLYQGALNDGRGLEEMIAAMQDLPNCVFWMAGEGDLSTALRSLVQEHGVKERVRFLGYVEPHELQHITAKAHIGVNLLRNKGLNYYYSLANKFFDYIQAAKPSLNMNFPEYATILKTHKVGILLDDLQPQTIVKAINQLIEQPDYYEQLQQNCQQAAQKFIWEKEEQKLLAFYENILG